MPGLNFLLLVKDNFIFVYCFFSVCYNVIWHDVIYLQMEDIKLDVQHAREAPTEHPQWEFEDEDEEDNSKADESDDQVIIFISFLSESFEK